MDCLKLSLPGKAFLAGEYLALNGGPALTVALDPCFELTIQSSNQKEVCPFHPQSAAGKLWQQYESYFSGFQMTWVDPNNGRGGLGGSTAEFALLHAFLQMRDSLSSLAQPQFDLHQMLRDYREHADQGGFKPSGADLVGQVQGGLTLFAREQGKLSRYGWLFKDLGFFLVRTKTKVKTHEHLKTLTDFDQSELERGMKLVQQALPEYDSQMFIEGMKIFTKALAHLELTCHATQELLQQLEHQHILVKKGCGALGADVLLIVFQTTQPSYQQEIKAQIDKLQLEIIGSHKSISYQGLVSEVIPLSAKGVELT